MPMDKRDFSEPIGILGYGVEGESTCRYLLGRGYRNLVVFDRKNPGALPDGAVYAGDGDYLARIPEMRTLFRSAGVRPDLPQLSALKTSGGVITSQVEHFLDMADRNRLIGVTGTLGKGTACTLLASMLNAASIPCRLGGNIGIPVLDLLPLADGELVILELSSFQLSTVTAGPVPAYAGVVRTTIEHLDWHVTKEEYWAHKSNLARFQKPGDHVVYCADAEGSESVAAASPGKRIAFGRGREVDVQADRVVWRKDGLEDGWESEFEIRLADLRIKGAFNLENIAAAGTLALLLGAPKEALARGAQDFTGLEHRLEFVREWNGRSFYNDSYATRPEATQGAVAAFATELHRNEGGGRLGLILGGSDKKADFGELARFLAAAPHMGSIALIGETAPRLENELTAAGYAGHRRRLGGLDEAFAYLLSEIPQGVILLSPACASFGLFANYKERGKAFKKLVSAL